MSLQNHLLLWSCWLGQFMMHVFSLPNPQWIIIKLANSFHQVGSLDLCLGWHLEELCRSYVRAPNTMHWWFYCFYLGALPQMWIIKNWAILAEIVVFQQNKFKTEILFILAWLSALIQILFFSFSSCRSVECRSWQHFAGKNGENGIQCSYTCVKSVKINVL